MSDRDEVERAASMELRDAAKNMLRALDRNGAVFAHHSELWSAAQDLLAALARPRDEGVGGDRDSLGRRVREVWIAWAKRQPAPKASWLVPYDDLSEADKEADRCIGAALWGDGFRDGIDAWSADGILRPATPPAPAAPKCGTCGGTREEPGCVHDKALPGHDEDLGCDSCRDPFHATPPRPVTPDDSAGALAAERERCAKVCGDRRREFVRMNVEGGMGKQRSYHFAQEAGECEKAIRALRDERGHDEPDQRGEDREAIEAARRGKGG